MLSKQTLVHMATFRILCTSIIHVYKRCLPEYQLTQDLHTYVFSSHVHVDQFTMTNVLKKKKKFNTYTYEKNDSMY